MKSFTKELWLEVPERRAIVSIHADVERLVTVSGVSDGFILVNAMHITASVFINDDESGLHADYERWLEDLVPSPNTFQLLVQPLEMATGNQFLEQLERPTGSACPDPNRVHVFDVLVRPFGGERQDLFHYRETIVQRLDRSGIRSCPDSR